MRVALVFGKLKVAFWVALVVMLLIAISSLGGVDESSDAAAMEYPSGTVVPEVFWPMYTAASDEYGVNPYLLASIHKQESEFSGDATGVDSGVNDDGCCAGPMQFNLSNTWAGHKNAFLPIKDQRPASYPNDRRELASCRGVPADEGCVYDSFDAIAAAAHKLSSQGADMDLSSRGTHDATCAYIGDCMEVDQCNEDSKNRYCEVLPRARVWEAKGMAMLSPGPSQAVSGTGPRSLARVKAVANDIDAQTERNQLPYCWGGGHGAKPGPSQTSQSPWYCWEGNSQIFGSKRLGLDCSGAVRWLLVQSGFPDPGGIASGSYGSYLKPGKGRHMSIYYGAGHIYAIIDGRVWQTSSSNRSHGPGWTGPGSAGDYTAVGHVEGL